MNEVIEVKGMTCGHCVNSVTTELQKISGVYDVSVELETGKVTINSDAPLARKDISDAIEEAGYELVG